VRLSGLNATSCEPMFTVKSRPPLVPRIWTEGPSDALQIELTVHPRNLEEPIEVRQDVAILNVRDDIVSLP
jgi:hypothetical protein